MVGRLTRALIAVIVVLATVLPVGLWAMPMPANMPMAADMPIAADIPVPASMTGMSVQQPCPNCPGPERRGVNPDRMPACRILACGGAIATLPSPALPLERVLSRTAYRAAPPLRWTAASRAPDPFPPRPIALV